MFKRHKKLISAAVVICIMLNAIPYFNLTSLSAVSSPVVSSVGSGSKTTTEIVEYILGENSQGNALTGTNINLIGNSNQIGIFEAPPGMGLPFDNGIVLATGNVSNTFTSSGIGGGYGTSGDTLLANLYVQGMLKYGGSSGGITNSAIVLEFTVTPDSNELSFEYFFTSNEYSQGANYNDVFGLWILGEDGIYHNIALLPDGDEVSVQSTLPVKGNTGSLNQEGIYYRPIVSGNKNGYNFNFLGHTISLFADATGKTDSNGDLLIRSGESATIRMGIANCGDDSVSSAVFIRADSVNISVPTTKHSVKFSLNGLAGNAPATQSVENNQPAVEPPDPQVSGFVFGGWYTESDCNNLYHFGDPVTSDITLYAKWTAQYTVKFSLNGVVGQPPPSEIIQINGKVTKPADPVDSVPLSDGTYRVFAGWYTDVHCSNEYDFNTPVTSNITLYAKWDPQPPQFVEDVVTGDVVQVIFDPTSGVNIAPDVADAIVGELITIPYPPPENDRYNFAGWYTEESCEDDSRWDFRDRLEVKNLNTNNATALTLYAKWETPLMFDDIKSPGLSKIDRNSYVRILPSVEMLRLDPEKIEWSASGGVTLIEMSDDQRYEHEYGTSGSVPGINGCIIKFDNESSTKGKDKVTLGAAVTYKDGKGQTKTKEFSRKTTVTNRVLNIGVVQPESGDGYTVVDNTIVFVKKVSLNLNALVNTHTPDIQSSDATNKPANGKVSWIIVDKDGNPYSAGKKVAKINGKGVLRAVGPGETYIMAVALDNKQKGEKKHDIEYRVMYKVICSPVVSVSFGSNESVTLSSQGSSVNLKNLLVFNPNYAFNQEKMKVKWESSGKNIASVDKNGIVTAKASSGEVKIKLTAIGGVPKGTTPPYAEITVKIGE